jgi:hypothetical protein
MSDVLVNSAEHDEIAKNKGDSKALTWDDLARMKFTWRVVRRPSAWCLPSSAASDEPWRTSSSTATSSPKDGKCSGRRASRTWTRPSSTSRPNSTRPGSRTSQRRRLHHARSWRSAAARGSASAWSSPGSRRWRRCTTWSGGSDGSCAARKTPSPETPCRRRCTAYPSSSRTRPLPDQAENRQRKIAQQCPTWKRILIWSHGRNIRHHTACSKGQCLILVN